MVDPAAPVPHDDQRLLTEYVRTNSQAAFTLLVRRHVDLVYSVALRGVGDHHLAEDITQAVFLLLARKAARLRPDVVVAGWLFTATRRICGDAIKSRRRRARHDARAAAQTPMAGTVEQSRDEPDWEKLAPLLNDAIGRLRGSDRDAILLRFFQNRTHQEIARILGVSEDAAKMRVSRAVTRLRQYFVSKGISTVVPVLAASLAARAMLSAAPAMASAAANPAEASPTVQALAARWGMRASALAAAGSCILFIAVMGISLHRHREAAPPGPPPVAAVARGDVRMMALIDDALADLVRAAATPVASQSEGYDVLVTRRDALAGILNANLNDHVRWLSPAPEAFDPRVFSMAWNQSQMVSWQSESFLWMFMAMGDLSITDEGGPAPRVTAHYDTQIAARQSNTIPGRIDCQTALPADSALLFLTPALAGQPAGLHELLIVEVAAPTDSRGTLAWLGSPRLAGPSAQRTARFSSGAVARLSLSAERSPSLDGGTQRYRALLHITGIGRNVTNPSISAQVPPGAMRAAIGWSSNRPSYDQAIMTLWLPWFYDKATVRVGVGWVPWRIAATATAADIGKSFPIAPDSSATVTVLSIAPSPQLSGMSEVKTLTQNFDPNYGMFIAAADAGNKLIQQSSNVVSYQRNGTGDAARTQVLTTVFDGPVSQIHSVRIQVQPLSWASFQNLQLPAPVTTATTLPALRLSPGLAPFRLAPTSNPAR